MGFTDRLRAWFKGESKRRTPSKSTDSASRSSTKELEEFVRTRTGVEGFLEPKTAIYSTTLLLVADDGEYLRRPIKSRDQAGELCDRVNIPLYDAAKVGYPRRMREFEQGRRPRKVDLSELPPWPGDDVADVGTTDGPPPPPVERTASAAPPDEPTVDGATGEGPPDDGATDADTGSQEPDEPRNEPQPEGSSRGSPPDEPRRDSRPEASPEDARHDDDDEGEPRP